MKPIVLFTIVLSLIFSTVTFGQSKTHYRKNTYDKTFSNCTNPPTFGTDSLALQNYLSDKLQDQISTTKGLIKISVLIDTLGKPKYNWVQNTSNYKMKKRTLNSLIDSMPTWTSGMQNGSKVNCVELIEMAFNNEHLAVSYRIGTE